MEELKVGREWEVVWEVTEARCAHAFGNTGVHVFGTPALVILMELVAADCLRPCLAEGQATVGTMVRVEHVSATPEGLKVRCKARVTSIDGRRVGFELEAFDDAGLIGRGTQERVIVTLERFLEKTRRKVRIENGK